MNHEIHLSLLAAWQFVRRFPAAALVEADVWHWVWPAYQRISREPGPGAVRRGYLACIDELRLALGRHPGGRRGLRERTGPLPEDHDVHPGREHRDFGATDARLDATLWASRMTPAAREAVELYFGLNGQLPMTQQEIADLLGTTPSAVTHRLRYGGVGSTVRRKAS